MTNFGPMRGIYVRSINEALAATVGQAGDTHRKPLTACVIVYCQHSCLDETTVARKRGQEALRLPQTVACIQAEVLVRNPSLA